MIRRIIQLAALLSLGIFIGSLSAQQTTGAVNLFCQDGNVKASTQGAPSTNTLQGSYPKCTVTVYLTGTTTHATIFKDSSSTPLANPFTANADGSFVFFAASKAGYDVVTSAGIPITFPQAFTYTDIWVPNDGGGGGTSLCGPLDSDSTSTNCGNGNFVNFTGTTGQAFGNTNIGTVNANHAVAVGDNNLASVAAKSFARSIVGVGSGNTTGITNTSTATDNLIGIGYQSLTSADGNDLIAIGDQSGETIPSNSNCASDDVIAVGNGTGSNLQVPTSNLIAIGNGAGDYLGANQTTNCSSLQPMNIVAIGDGAGSINASTVFTGGPVLTPTDLVAVGDGAGTRYGGSLMVAVGTAGGTFLAGSTEIVAVGDHSGVGTENMTSGHLIPTATVHDLIAIGDNDAWQNSGSENIAIGDHNLWMINGNFPTVGNSGTDNIALGDHALSANTTGSHNIAIGYFVGSNGWSGPGPIPTIGNSNQTGSQNTWIGDTSGPISTTQLSNTVALGYGANPTVSNQTVIGNNSITAVTIYGVGTGCLSASSGVITGSGSACGSGGGGGSNVTVNGGSTLTTANFGTLPAAGSNGLNVTWQNSGNNVSAEIVGDGVSTHFLNGNGGWTAPAGGGSGTVTSVSFTGGLISVATATTTPALTVAGTSGGVPYFSGAATWASSAALPSGDFVLGGGAGSAPTASFSIVTAAKGGTGIANTATLTLGTSNQNWATLGTGIVKNTTTTGAISDAASSDVIGLWTGTCSSSTFLRGDGACAAGGGGGTPGGSAGNLQYNLAGTSFGGDANTNDDGAGNLSAVTLSTTSSSGAGGGWNATEGTIPAGFTAAAGHDFLYADSTSHCLMYSANGVTYACIGSGSGSSIKVNGGTALASPVNLQTSSGAGQIDVSNPSGSNVQYAVHNTATTVNGQTCTLGSTCTVTAAATTPYYFAAATCTGGVAFTSALGTYDNNQPSPGCTIPASSTSAYLAFAQTPANPQYAEAATSIPAFFTSTSIQIQWYTTVTSGNVIWEVQTACPAAGSTVGAPTFGTATTVTSTAPGTAGTSAVATISNIAVAGANGCPSGSSNPATMVFRIFRSGSDTAAAAANLISVTLLTSRSQ